jgi:hypothetical protein
MSQFEREDMGKSQHDDAIMGLLIAGGIGIVVGSLIGTRVIKRTIKTLIVRTVIKRVLDKIGV